MDFRFAVDNHTLYLRCFDVDEEGDVGVSEDVTGFLAVFWGCDDDLSIAVLEPEGDSMDGAVFIEAA